MGLFFHKEERQAVSENGLTSFKIEEGNLKLSIKKEKEQIITVAGNSAVQQMIPAAGVAVEMAALPAAEYTAPAGSGEGAQTAENTAAAIDSDKIVASPLVGTFYNSSSPDAEPFVKVGDAVKKGQTLGIIEAMKLMNEIESEFDGIVEAVLVGNENVVEYGQPLFRIR